MTSENDSIKSNGMIMTIDKIVSHHNDYRDNMTHDIFIGMYYIKNR